MSRYIHKKPIALLLESIGGEKPHYDDFKMEAFLDDLEQGKEVMMSEEDYQSLKSFCLFEQIDYVFDVQVYGNGVAVRIIDDYNDHLHRV